MDATTFVMTTNTDETAALIPERLAAAMERVLHPPKVCHNEAGHEIQATTDWADLLLPAAAVPTALQELEPEANKRYAPEQKLLLVDKLLDKTECERVIDAAEAIGFGKTNYAQAYRGNLRLTITDHGLAAALFERVRPHVPATLEDAHGAKWRVIGLNEVIRLAKYYEGTRFGAHVDAWFERNRDERTFYTVNVYANTVAAENGGRTRFFREENEMKQDKLMQKLRLARPVDDKDIELQVQPVAGRAVVFRHGPRENLLHDGERLAGGVKYLLRTDVCYRRVLDKEEDAQ